MTLLKRKTKQPKAAKVNGNGGAKQFLSKISGAFMLPISVMAIAGLFLGVGAAIASHSDGALQTFGQFIQQMGDPVFGAMPMLFAAAIVVAFTDEAGVAVFAAIIGMLIFSGLQSVFIDSVDHNTIMATASPVKGTHDGFTFTNVQAGADAIKGLDPSGNPTSIVAGSTGFVKANHDGYKVLFAGAGRTAGDMEHLIGTTLGIQTLNTSVFGGIAVGAVVAYLYNRFHTIELPQMISFFGGKRFVSLAVIVAMVPMAFIFLLLWPYIGFGLSKFGNAIGSLGGAESFIFGYVERALIPFGLHHVFYASLWWTNAGGDSHQQLLDFNAALTSNGHEALIGSLKNGAIDPSLPSLIGEMDLDKTKWMGDSYTWLAANGLHSDVISWQDKTGVAHQAKVFAFFNDQLDLKLGRFMQGKFPFMIFALPAAAFAMVMAAPKENRKMALGTVFPAALTSFVTGVTEPIEFTFLFLAPLLFWGFHAIMAGLSFLAMTLLGAHVGMTFSGGFLDLMIYGAIPFGKGTDFYWVFVIGPILAPIYYAVFYWAIKRFNLETPGRGSNTKLFSKADFKAKKAGTNGAKGLKPQSAAIVAAYGGWENITRFTNCATRLRYDVKDGSKVDVAALKAAGAAGVTKISDTHFQAIMGPQAEQINTNIKGNQGADLGDAVTAAPAKPATKAATKSVVTTLKAVTSGTVKALSTMDNGSFAVMGKGVAISPNTKTSKAQKFYSPFAGEVTLVFPTKHAYGIKAANGVEVLIHIGVDTVKLDGKGFKAKVKQGDKVKTGDLIAEADFSAISKKVPSVDTAIVVTSGQDITSVLKGKATKASTIFKTK